MLTGKAESAATAQMVAISAIASAVDIRTLRWLKVSLTDTTLTMTSAPAATAA